MRLLGYKIKNSEHIAKQVENGGLALRLDEAFGEKWDSQECDGWLYINLNIAAPSDNEVDDFAITAKYFYDICSFFDT